MSDTKLSDTRLRETRGTKGKGRDTKGKGRDTGTGGSRRSGTYSDVVDDLQDVLTGIPDRPEKGLMTFEELQAKMGSKPKKNRFFGKYKMSTRYKAIGQALEEVKDKLASASVGTIADEGGRQAFEQELNNRLDGVVAAGKRYQKKHKGKKGRAVQDLLDDVERVRKDIPRTLDALTEGDDGPFPDDLPVDQAIAAARNGIKPRDLEKISLKHCNFTLLNDDRRDGPARTLGKGAVNTVQLVKHGGVERVFKEEQKSDNSGAWAPGLIGLDPKTDPRYGNRNVAGGTIGKLLGTSVMPQSQFGISDGKVGLVMEKAPGKTMRELTDYDDLDNDVLAYDSLSPKARASLQRQLMDLEVCDILTGQADRHRGNYMVDIKGDQVTVTGIDNDFAFPNPTKAVAKGIPPKFLGITSIGNLPLLMSREIANRLRAIDFDRDVAQEMAGLLDEDEIEGTRLRFERVLEHIDELETAGCIVDNWETWRSPPPKSLAADDFLGEAEGSSLFKREFLT